MNIIRTCRGSPGTSWSVQSPGLPASSARNYMRMTKDIRYVFVEIQLVGWSDNVIECIYHLVKKFKLFLFKCPVYNPPPPSLPPPLKLIENKK